MKTTISLLFVTLFLSISAISAQQPEVVAEAYFMNDRVDVLEMPLPEYPLAAKEKGLGGMVTVAITIDETGTVTSTGDATGPGSVCKSVTDPAVLSLREAAVSAAKMTRFKPSTMDGKPITRVAYIRYTFQSSNPSESDISVKELTGASLKSEDSSVTAESKTTGKAGEDLGMNTIRLTKIGTTGETTNSGEPRQIDKANVLRADSTGLPKTVSGGVLNGKAISLPKPAYPPAARAVRASGAVSVQVLITENGFVYSASAVSGHPLLRQSSAVAACSSRFPPTLLSGTPVKVSGIITYNYVP